MMAPESLSEMDFGGGPLAGSSASTLLNDLLFSTSTSRGCRRLDRDAVFKVKVGN